MENGRVVNGSDLELVVDNESILISDAGAFVIDGDMYK